MKLTDIYNMLSNEVGKAIADGWVIDFEHTHTNSDYIKTFCFTRNTEKMYLRLSEDERDYDDEVYIPLRLIFEREQRGNYALLGSFWGVGRYGEGWFFTDYNDCVKAQKKWHERCHNRREYDKSKWKTLSDKRVLEAYKLIRNVNGLKTKHPSFITYSNDDGDYGYTINFSDTDKHYSVSYDKRSGRVFKGVH